MADNDYHVDEKFRERANKALDEKKYDVVYSTNYNEMLAQASCLHDIPYLAWTYDSHSYHAGNKYSSYPNASIFVFDSEDLGNYQKNGVERSYYLPLAADTDYYDSIICTDADREKYNADISFVGRLYDSVITTAMAYLTDYQKAYLGALIDNQTDMYGYNFMTEIMVKEFAEWISTPGFNKIINDELIKHNGLNLDNSDETISPDALMFMLNNQVTNKERILLLTLLAKHHHVKLYSTKTNELFKDLEFCGTAGYYTEMPRVFKCSKINLNATFRAIQNGIPLRCIDIMGCGGLLLTNYQKDFDEHFRDGENLVFYQSAEEALDKTNFYLSHDQLREKVALSGYETIKKYYSYPVKIREMLELAGLQNLIKACGR
jgi:spore maturation protein CgeB